MRNGRWISAEDYDRMIARHLTRMDAIMKAEGERLAAIKCDRCEDSGFVMEKLDDDRPPVKFPCQNCRVWCKACGNYQKRPHVHEEVK
jgi:hypothetical protein